MVTILRLKSLICPTILPLAMAGGRTVGFIPFPRVLALCEMQSTLSRIWTQMTVSVSSDGNHYIPSTFIYIYIYIYIHILIHRNILPTDPNKKIKLIIYYNKFKTSNLVIRNNSSLSIGVLQKTNVIYKFKCPLGDCISDNNNIYVGLTSTTLSRRLTMHLSDTSSIAQHLKKYSCPTT